MNRYAINNAVPFVMHNTCANENEIRRAAEAYNSLIENPIEFPCVFALDGVLQHGFENFNLIDTKHSENDVSVSDVLTFKHESGLVCRAKCLHYPRYAAYEWTLFFENTSNKNSPRISSLAPAHLYIEGKNPHVTGILGDARNEDYGLSAVSLTNGMNGQPFDIELPLGIEQYHRCSGGCASNHEFPYFKMQTDSGAVITAIGWPGQWKARLLADKRGILYSVGQEVMDTFLYPQESMRTPMVLFVLCDGTDQDRHTNLWRRFFMDCNMPRKDGYISQPVLGASTNGTGMMTMATEENQIAQIKEYRRHGIHPTAWWMDAGWYELGNGEYPAEEIDYGFTGTWKLRERDFPTNLSAISDCMAEHGGQTLLWFEPERCGISQSELKNDGSTLKPEWLLKGYDQFVIPRNGGSKIMPVRCVNLGNEEAYEWIRDRIFKVLREGKISIYREDHNFRPFRYWVLTDENGRAGMVENKYITNHLRLWDEIRENFDEMILDSCASGGRRNDIESMRRAVPLHYTDYFTGSLSARNGIHCSLFNWFPYFKTEIFPAILKNNPLDYALRSSMGTWTQLIMDLPKTSEEEFEKVRKYITEWETVNKYFYADYYMLSPWSVDAGKWIACMFLDGCEGKGFIMAYRRAQNDDESYTFALKGLERDAKYRICNLASGEVTESDGESLMSEGLTVTLKEVPAAATLTVERV